MADLFRGAIIRDCLVKNVVDGKTLKVLLNPLGWTPRPAGGWAARPTSVAAQDNVNEPQQEVRRCSSRFMVDSRESHHERTCTTYSCTTSATPRARLE